MASAAAGPLATLVGQSHRTGEQRVGVGCGAGRRRAAGHADRPHDPRSRIPGAALPMAAPKCPGAQELASRACTTGNS